MALQVQERALLVVPNLCETIDYAEVQSVLFPRVAVRPISCGASLVSSSHPSSSYSPRRGSSALK